MLTSARCLFWLLHTHVHTQIYTTHAFSLSFSLLFLRLSSHQTLSSINFLFSASIGCTTIWADPNHSYTRNSIATRVWRSGSPFIDRLHESFSIFAYNARLSWILSSTPNYPNWQNTHKRMHLYTNASFYDYRITYIPSYSTTYCKSMLHNSGVYKLLTSQIQSKGESTMPWICVCGKSTWGWYCLRYHSKCSSLVSYSFWIAMGWSISLQLSFRPGDDTWHA